MSIVIPRNGYRSMLAFIRNIAGLFRVFYVIVQLNRLDIIASYFILRGEPN